MLIFLGFTVAPPAIGQVNSWTKPTSGSWEEPFWSFGVLPGPGQTVAIDNPGWKAVQITWNTVQTQPQSLTVGDLTIASPVDSFNTLLLNYAGFQQPLTVRSLKVERNAALRMLSSALHLGGPTGVGMSIGGEVTQADNARLTGNQFDVGYVGPGVYNLQSGTIDVGHMWVGGPYLGVFNHDGGSVTADVLHLTAEGTYNLRGGDFDAVLHSGAGADFRHEGGQVHSHLEFHQGRYHFSGGINYGGVSIPVAANFSDDNGDSMAFQTGGTNLGPTTVGVWGAGWYTLEQGVVQSPAIRIGRFGFFEQKGGTVTTPATLVVRGDYYDRGGVAGAYYRLESGLLSAPSIQVDTGGFTQSSGTNQVAGELRVGPATRNFASTTYTLNGGLLATENTALDLSPYGGFFQNGGIHRIANQLTVSGESLTSFPPTTTWNGYVLQGGELHVSNIVVNPRAAFMLSGGALTHLGMITLNAAQLHVEQSGNYQFGPLQLTSSGTYTNTKLHHAAMSGITRFRDSRALPWAANARLLISSWDGFPEGGGFERIIFGNSAAALTPAQVAQIYFDFGPGNQQPARILSTGEIVPDRRTGQNPPRMVIRKQTADAVELTVTGDPGANYGIETSLNLTDWAFWTNRVATNGSMSAVDSPIRNRPKRFYRALLMQ